MIHPRPEPPLTVGKPFLSKFSCWKGDAKSPVVTGDLCRDSKGRIRIDNHMVSGEIMTSIDDIIDHALTFIISSGSDRFVVNEEYKEPRSVWSFAHVHPQFSNEYKELLGVSCRRVNLYVLPSGEDLVGFAWIAEKEGLVMEDVEPRTGWRWVITSITFREPDASAFSVPRGVEDK